MNIKQRAQELLTCDELLGRLPEEVQDFLRDVVALKPVAGIKMDGPRGIQNKVLDWPKGCIPFIRDNPVGTNLYTLGAPNDPA